MGNVYVLITRAVFAASVSLGGSINGTLAAPVLPAIGLPGAGLASSVRRRISLPSAWSWIPCRCHALALADREEQILVVGGEGDSAPN